MNDSQQDKELYGFKEILYEYNPKGRYLSVCALDPETLLEATVIAPKTAHLESLKRMAARKLRIVVDRKQGKQTLTNDKKSVEYGKQEDNSGWNL